MTLLRKLALIAIGAGIMALALTLVANPHALPIKGTWNSHTLAQKARYVRANLRHARGVLNDAHARRTAYSTSYGRAIVRAHRRLAAKAARNWRAIELRLHPPFSYPWWWAPLGVCETSSNPPDPAFVGGGYFGWINFAQSTWEEYGGLRYAPSANLATEYEQYLVTLRMHADVPWSQSNPACSARLGL